MTLGWLLGGTVVLALPMTTDTANTNKCSPLYFYSAINRISSFLERDSTEPKAPRGEGNIINPFIEDVVGFLSYH